jgi:GAF domain-containing protein
MTKEEIYQTIVPQIQALMADETDEIANMANMVSVLHETFGFWWTGFYRVERKAAGVGELVLWPFQGPIACTRIPYNKGVCGTAGARKETVIVPDVHLFPGHIACSSVSKSEIVVPFFKNGEVFAVLDIDSEELNTFDEIDRIYLEQLAQGLI